MKFRIQHVVAAVLLGALTIPGVLGLPGVARAAPQPPPAQPLDWYSVAPEKISQVAPRGAYTAWRWVGIRKPKLPLCPAVPGWQVEPLYTVPPLAADKPLLRKLGLDRYCVYTAPPGNAFPRFPRTRGLIAAAPDRMALSASGDLDDLVAPVLGDTFYNQAGRVDLARRPGWGAAGVRLTFLDSQPAGDTRPSGSQHGYTLSRLALKLVGNSAAISTRRALSYADTGSGALPPHPLDAGKGGHVGLVGDLATAILDEVFAWRKAGSPGHLILNLSLGWDGELFGDLRARRIEDLAPEVQRVYSALCFAAEKNVLVIAAAGNRRGGPVESTKPVLPAAWELQRPGACRSGFSGKLVYAVGGVDWQGLPLPNSRQGGLPTLVAYGDHATNVTRAAPGKGATTSVYTGTSVAAAVVSSTAAVIWDLRPELSREKLMAAISDSGELLDAQADFYSEGDSQVRRVSLCAAVSHVCRSGAAACPALVSAPQCPVWNRQPPQLSGLFPSASDGKDPSPFHAASGSFPLCNPRMRLMIRDGDVPTVPCPADQLSSVANQRWLMPQPEDDPCPNCSLLPRPPGSNRYALKLDIGEAWRTVATRATLESATLDIDRFDSSGRFVRTTYPVPLPRSGSSIVEISGLGDGLPLTKCRAQLNFVVKKDGVEMSIQNPVVVDP